MLDIKFNAKKSCLFKAGNMFDDMDLHIGSSTVGSVSNLK